MRSLIAVLSTIILGSLILIGVVVKVVSDKYYEDEITQEYLHYSKLITIAIQKDLEVNVTNIKDKKAIDSILYFWKSKVGEELIALKISEKPLNLPSEFKGKVSHIFISEQRDELSIIVPIELSAFKNKVLKFSYQSEFSQHYMLLYYSSIFAGYILMLILVSLIARFIHRYIKQIRKVTKSVANGDFYLKMADSRISTIQNLSDDINSMVNTIEEKTSDNLILTGAIHHELRIPMTRIRLALDMALQGESSEMVSELLAGMDDDFEELSSLTEKILTISRMRLCSIELKTERIKFPDILEQVVHSFDSDNIDYDCYEKFTLNGNRILIERAIFNVIDNALKYCRNRVSISTSLVNSEYIITIDDDGTGIEKQFRDLVLKPFYRTDKSRNRKTGGFGLGLAITDMVIKESGGKIVILPSNIGGTRIQLIWPTYDVRYS